MSQVDELSDRVVDDVRAAMQRRVEELGQAPRIVYLGIAECNAFALRDAAHGGGLPVSVYGLAVQWVDRPSCVAVE